MISLSDYFNNYQPLYGVKPLYGVRPLYGIFDDTGEPWEVQFGRRTSLIFNSPRL